MKFWDGTFAFSMCTDNLRHVDFALTDENVIVCINLCVLKPLLGYNVHCNVMIN